MTTAQQNQQKTAHIPECVSIHFKNFQVASSKTGENGQVISQHRPQSPLWQAYITRDLSILVPTTYPKEQILLPYGLCSYPRTSSVSPSLTPCISSQCEFFQTDYVFLPQTVSTEEPRNSRTGDVSSPPGAAAGCSACRPQGLALPLGLHGAQ